MQKLALLSNLQGIDAMVAIVVLEEVGIFKKFAQPIHYEPFLDWRIDGIAKRLSFTTLHRAALASGIMYIRGLLELLGIKARKKLSEYSDVHRYFHFCSTKKTGPGEDLHWTHIERATGLTSEVLQKYATRDITIDNEMGELLPFAEVIYGVLKAGDKSIAHLTHLSEQSTYYAGAIVAVGSFVAVAIQELVLRPSWGETFDADVFECSKQLLPSDHFQEHMQHVAVIRESLRSILDDSR